MALLTPEQQCAVDARGRIVCADAGAGSGKTRVLVQRILDLIERDGIELNRIAAITFTDKAAGDMKERLRRACREKAPPDDPSRMSFWRRMERQVDSSRICTIHTFCSGVLRENALSLGLDPDFAILTEAESEVLRSEVAMTTVYELLDNEDVFTHMAANEYGLACLNTVLHDLLRQQNLVERLSENGATGAEIAAAWEQKRPEIEAELLRIAARARKLRFYLRELESCAGYCTDSGDKRERVRIALAGFLSQLANERAPSVIRELAKQISDLKAEQGKKSKGVLVNWTCENAYKKVKDVLNGVKAHLRSAMPPEIDWECEARAVEITAAVLHLYRKTADALREAKRSRNVLDFDDLIAKAAEVLRDTSRSEDSVCARTARGIDHLLIDEFQDTDSVQYEIARLLADTPGGPELFVVGDAKQSIYYFRGAEVDVFNRVRGDAGVPLPMRGNFRTAPPVLQFINSFFQESELLSAVESPFQALVARREAMKTSRIEFLVPPQYAEKPRLDEYRGEEARMIAAGLDAIRDGSLTVFDNIAMAARPARFGDVAILLRSLSNVHLYERALREAGIPYTLVAGKGFYERQEVLDLRNLLAFLVDPCDELSLVAFLRGPMAALSDDALIPLAGGIGAPRGVLAGFLSDIALTDAEQNARLTRARHLIASLRVRIDLPLGELLQHVFDLTGIEGIVLRQFMGPQRASNLRKVAALAESFSGVRPPTLRAFVRYLDDMAAREIREGEAASSVDDRHSVTVMTVHKAKGLEFPIVYVADLGRDARNSGNSEIVAVHKNVGIAAKILGKTGTFVAPALHSGIRALRAEEEMAEQARILYVAMTRARDHLFLCGAPVAEGGASWMAAFDEQYGVCAKGDGEALQGDGWQAVIRREVSKAAFANTHDVETRPADIARIRTRIGPVSTSPVEMRHIAATALAAAVRGTLPSARAVAGGRPMAEASSLQRGTILHGFLERWDYQSDPESTIESILRVEALDDSIERMFRDDMRRIAARLGSGALNDRVVRSHRVQREVPFSLRIDTFLARGTLDLLIDGAVIVDFKTGRPSHDDLAVYETQLQLYAAALRELTGVQSPEAYLALLDVNADFTRAVDVSPSTLDDVLERARAMLPLFMAQYAAP